MREPPGRTTYPARRTNADKRVAIMPGRELIRTMLNATQVTTDQKAGAPSAPTHPATSQGSSPAKKDGAIPGSSLTQRGARAMVAGTPDDGCGRGSRPS